MTRLVDLMDPLELAAAIDDGLVRAKRHPELPLTIYNYAEKADYSRTWTPVTTQCRGLVVHDNGDIVARPWPKFFNYGEREVGTWGGGNVPVEVVDKLDGSLGILVQPRAADTSDVQPLIATRGSFTSDQAEHATRHYAERYARRWNPAPWLTYLFEIVYPANRIVCDYGQLDDLILLGAVDTVTGEAFGPTDLFVDHWPGPRAEVLPEKTMTDVLKRTDRQGAEGVVVRITDGPDKGLMFKLKQADYVAAHRIVTGLNARTVWEAYGNGTVEDLLASLPDEFHGWVQTQTNQLVSEVVRAERAARNEYRRITGDLLWKHSPDDYTRGDFAREAKHYSDPALLFALLDGKDIRPMIHKTLRPSGADAPRIFDEAAA
jgi:RNA ligase